jgi:hypothetical protein
VVAEACRAGLPIFASDIDPEAIALTRHRLEKLGRTVSPVAGVLGAAELTHRVFVHDVFRGFPQRVTARIVVSNMPWGKQVLVENTVKLCNATTELVALALLKGGACALLMTHPDLLISRLRKRLGNVRITSRHLGLLGQNPTIVEVRLS